MPPLHRRIWSSIGRLQIFFGAMYLYSINCVHLYFYFFHRKVPKVPKQLDDKSQKQVKYIISVLITVLILPSIYFAYLIEEKVPTPN
jgi:hypothetical protein